MADYRKDFIAGKIAGTQPRFEMRGGLMFIICDDGFEFEVLPRLKRSLISPNEKTGEITTITKSSVSVRLPRERAAKQERIPGVCP